MLTLSHALFADMLTNDNETFPSSISDSLPEVHIMTQCVPEDLPDRPSVTAVDH